MNNTNTMNRLETIAFRQRKTFARDLIFMAAVALAAAIGVSSVTTAANGASTQQIVQR
jgi:hypothetical protein